MFRDTVMPVKHLSSLGLSLRATEELLQLHALEEKEEAGSVPEIAAHGQEVVAHAFNPSTREAEVGLVYRASFRTGSKAREKPCLEKPHFFLIRKALVFLEVPTARPGLFSLQRQQRWHLD